MNHANQCEKQIKLLKRHLLSNSIYLRCKKVLKLLKLTPKLNNFESR